jgi:hypothetical protein
MRAQGAVIVLLTEGENSSAHYITTAIAIVPDDVSDGSTSEKGGKSGGDEGVGTFSKSRFFDARRRRAVGWRPAGARREGAEGNESARKDCKACLKSGSDGLAVDLDYVYRCLGLHHANHPARVREGSRRERRRRR